MTTGYIPRTSNNDTENKSLTKPNISQSYPLTYTQRPIVNNISHIQQTVKCSLKMEKWSAQNVKKTHIYDIQFHVSAECNKWNVNRATSEEKKWARQKNISYHKYHRAETTRKMSSTRRRKREIEIDFQRSPGYEDGNCIFMRLTSGLHRTISGSRGKKMKNCSRCMNTYKFSLYTRTYIHRNTRASYSTHLNLEYSVSLFVPFGLT